MKILKVSFVFCLSICLGSHLLFAQNYNDPRLTKNSQQAMVAMPDLQATQETVDNSAIADLNEYDYQQYPKGFWASVGSGFAATGRGIAKVSKWTWKGICKGSYYTKEGCVSFAEVTGMISNKDEVTLHNQVMLDANDTLVGSRAKREVRKEQFRQKLVVQN